MTFAHASIGLDDAGYGALLRDYLHERLPLRRGVAADEALVARIIAAAEGRFVYVSFLADRSEALGRERFEDEMPSEGRGSGEALYGRWLADLDRNFGRKEADRIRQVLCVLAAAELAHGWVYASGKRADPVGGAALTMLGESFAGLPVEALATVLDSDVIERIGEDGETRRLFGSVLLFTLERIEGVLRTSRGAGGGRRFRIGLKDLAEVIVRDDALSAGIVRAQAALASQALDLVDRLLTEDAAAPGALDRELLLALLPLSEAAVHLSGSDLLAARFDPDRMIEVLYAEVRRCDDEMRLDLRIALCSHMMALTWQPPGATLADLPSDQRNGLAAWLENRGNVKWQGGALPEAIADYDAAIRIRQGLRDALEPQGQWPIPLRNQLAGSLQNRGVAKADGGALAESITDYDAAIRIMQDLRDALEPQGQWPIPLRNQLAKAHFNRHIALEQAGRIAAAKADLTEAIAIKAEAVELANNNAPASWHDDPLRWRQWLNAIDGQSEPLGSPTANGSAPRSPWRRLAKWLKQGR